MYQISSFDVNPPCNSNIFYGTFLWFFSYESQNKNDIRMFKIVLKSFKTMKSTYALSVDPKRRSLDNNNA